MNERRDERKLTPEAIAMMRGHEEKANPPPWKLWGSQVMWDANGDSDVNNAVPICDAIDRERNGDAVSPLRCANAYLIADLRNHARPLLDAAEENADLRQQLAEKESDNRRLTRAFEVVSEGCRDRIEDIKSLELQLAAQAAELEKLRDERDHYEASSKRWLEISRNLFKLKRTYRLECESKAAELATLRERLAECDTYHAPRIAELERLNKEQFDRFSDLLSVLGNINQCRTAEGDSIEILCDNPEAWSVDKQAAVEASGAYTDYEPTKFFGSTWQEALQKAADCARRYYSG